MSTGQIDVVEVKRRLNDVRVNTHNTGTKNVCVDAFRLMLQQQERIAELEGDNRYIQEQYVLKCKENDCMSQKLKNTSRILEMVDDLIMQRQTLHLSE